MSSAKEMRFMQIYSENERKNKRVKELILGWQTRYFMFNCFNGIKTWSLLMHRKGTEYNELFAVLSKAQPNFLYIWDQWY